MPGKFSRIFREIFCDPMPMGNFKDYDDYWEKRGQQEPKFRFVWVCDNLPNQGSLLDVGCGDGAFLDYIRDKKPKLKTTGIDGSLRAVEKAHKSGISAVQCTDLNTPDLSAFREVDVIVAMEVIEHLAEPEKLMHEFLKTKAGIFYITIPNLGFIVHRLRLALGGKMPTTSVVYHIKEHLRHWTVRDFDHWAKQCGFRVTSHKGQNGFFGLWKIFPALFARQMIYVLQRIK